MSAGNWNELSPTIQGLEVRPSQQFIVPSKNNNGGLVQRVRPGAVTISHIHTFLRDVFGSPGLGIELLNSNVPPTITDEVHFPGTDTGATTTGWQTFASGAATFAAIDDQFDDSDGLRNTASLGVNSSLALKFRGNDTALTSKRVDKVQLWARASLLPGTTFTSRSVRVRGRINIGGTDYTYDAGVWLPADGRIYTVKIAEWRLNPSTGLPWTQAEVNALVSTTATDEFGLVIDKAVIAAGGFRLSGAWSVLSTAAENRISSYYQSSPPRPGWSRNTLTTQIGGALSASTYYYVLIYALRGAARDYFDIPVLYDPTATIINDPTATGEHRLGSAVLLTGASGIIAADVADVPGSFMPFLLDSSGTIRDQSVAYTELDRLVMDSTQPANRGQEVTTSGTSTAYAGVSLPIAWADPNTPPDQPLVVELRDGAGMLTGAGNLRGTATFSAHQNPMWPGIDPAGADTFVKFDGGNVTPPINTQSFLLVKSAASSGKGWQVGRLDSRSDFLSSGGNTTQANVEGETFGGTTDSYSEAGTESDRYDLPIALIAPPAAPAAPTVTVRAAA